MPIAYVASDCSAVYPALCLHTVLGIVIMQQQASQTFSELEWSKVFLVVPHIHTGPVEFFTALALTKQLPA